MAEQREGNFIEAYFPRTRTGAWSRMTKREIRQVLTNLMQTAPVRFKRKRLTSGTLLRIEWEEVIYER